MANPCHSPDIEPAQFCVGIGLARALYVSEINGLGYAAALFSWVSRKTTRHGDTESESHNATTAQSVRRFRDSRGPESTSSDSSDRLRNAGLCHFLLDIAESYCPRFLLLSWHKTIMPRRRKPRTVNSDQRSRFWRCVLRGTRTVSRRENPQNNRSALIPAERC